MDCIQLEAGIIWRLRGDGSVRLQVGIGGLVGGHSLNAGLDLCIVDRESHASVERTVLHPADESLELPDGIGARSISTHDRFICQILLLNPADSLLLRDIVGLARSVEIVMAGRRNSVRCYRHLTCCRQIDAISPQRYSLVT